MDGEEERQFDSGEVRSCIAVETKRAWSLMASKASWSFGPRHPGSEVVASALSSIFTFCSLISRASFSPPTGSLRWGGLKEKQRERERELFYGSLPTVAFIMEVLTLKHSDKKKEE